MTTRKNIILSLGIVFGIFIVLGSVSASPAEDLQPAATVTYNETVNINGRLNARDMRVGDPINGGVFRLNGSVINEGGPFVVSDDYRLDGRMWRGTTKGMADNMPLLAADTFAPALNNMNDLGLDGLRWRHLFLAGNLQGVGANLTGELRVTGASSFADNVTIGDFLAVGGGGGQGVSGTTIDTNGNIVTDSTITAGALITGDITATGTITSSGNIAANTASFSGDVTANGDINQSLTNNGAVKLSVSVYDDGSCSGSSQWVYDGTPIICSSSSDGVYTITYTPDFSSRFISAVPLNPNPRFITLENTTNHILTVRTFNISGTLTATSFMIVFY